jgi:hypothetical protein
MAVSLGVGTVQVWSSVLRRQSGEKVVIDVSTEAEGTGEDTADRRFTTYRSKRQNA